MIIRKCNDYVQVYGGKLLNGNVRDNRLYINHLQLNIGDKVCFIINDKVYEGYLTDFEKPLYGESYGEVSFIYVDNEEFSIYDISWLGVE